VTLPKTAVWGARETALGWVGLLATPAGVARIVLPRSRETEIPERLGVRDGQMATRDDKAVSRWLRPLARALEGGCVNFSDWTLDWKRATPFQRRVWETARQIPRGQTRSYWWVAVRSGNPRAARAVGSALGANPLPLVVPCHRVVRADGHLGGFGGGLPLKRRLLALEGAEVAPEPLRVGQA
jgi:methylated-DNA-[protein]-cysteine S-methyltransferase